MTDHELLAKWPGLKEIKPDRFGISRVYFLNSFKEWDRAPQQGEVFAENMGAVPAMNGVQRIALLLVDRRIAQIRITYDNDIKWTSDLEFVKNASSGLGVNREWKKNESSYSLSCAGGLHFMAGIGSDYSMKGEALLKRPSGPYIIMSDTFQSVQPETREYKEQSEKEKKRKDVFVP